MEELGLVDDEAYAARLAGEYIRRLYPRRRAVQELCGRGIGRELAEAAVDGMGTADADLALALLRKKYYNKLRDADGRRRTAAALARQGFSYEDIRYAFAGDLLEQNTATFSGMKELGIPLFGLFGACSTVGEAMSLAAMSVAGGFAKHSLAIVPVISEVLKNSSVFR